MITKDIPVEDLVQDFPDSVVFLSRKRIVCIQCGEPVWGSLEEAMKRAKIAEPDKVLEELNEFLKLKT